MGDEIDNGSKKLAILIPAYNEEDRIGPTLEEYMEYFGAREGVRVVVVLNGCRDMTSDIVKSYQGKHGNLELVDIPQPVGKGGALIEGMRRCCDYDLISYVDADGATSARALDKLIEQLDEDTDVVIGSRWMRGAVLHQSQTWSRKVASRVFHLIVELLFRMRIVDTQCPAKVARGHVIRRILPQLSVADLAFDVNFLYSAHREGFRIREYATEWTDKDGSTVTRNLVRSSLVMFLSVVRLRLIYSPYYQYLGPFRPLEQWLYFKFGGPPPVPGKERVGGKDE